MEAGTKPQKCWSNESETRPKRKSNVQRDPSYDSDSCKIREVCCTTENTRREGKRGKDPTAQHERSVTEM
jgi:hypothetical protein